MRTDVRFLPMAVMAVCSAMFFLDSCAGEEVDVRHQETGAVAFVLKDAECFTKSILSTSETAVRDISLFAYYDGLLLASGHWKAGEKMTLELDADEVYDFYALANMGDVTLPVLETEVKDFVYEISGISGLGDAFPMCWSLKDHVPGDGPVEVWLTRLVSKVMLDVDCGDTGLKVTGVSLVQSPLSVCPFVPGGSKAVSGKVSVGDRASSSDLSVLDSGGSVVFYMLENMQGTLLSGNRDPMNKVPSNVNGKSDVCTYVEVGCEFMGGSGRDGTSVYRMYLGKDETTNFDVVRNSVLRLSLTLTSDGLKVKDSWKITPDYIQHPTGLDLDAGTMSLIIGQKGSLSATVLPADAADKRVMWQTSDAEVAVVSAGGVVTAKGEGTCTIKCISTGRPEIYAECKVTVSDAIVSLSFDRSRAEAVLDYDGGTKTTSFTVQALYLSGKTVSVTDVCTYASSSAAASVKVPGVVTHELPGEAVITAKYEGLSATMTVVTEAFAVSSVEFEQQRYSMSLGEDLVVRYRVLYNDGTASKYITYVLVNQMCWSGIGYSMGDGGIASVSDYGRVTANSVGQTVIGVSVLDIGSQKTYEASATLTVNEAYLVSVYAVAPAMFYGGSEGPGLYGVYSDGSERNLTASASWTSGNSNVTYSPSAGLVVRDSHNMTEGVTLVTFTGTYRGKSASVTMKYGKWLRGVVFVKTSAGAGTYNYRMVVVYDDFTEVAVPFTYQTSTDGKAWSAVKSGTASGVNVAATMPETRLRGKTADTYLDSAGNSLIWTIGY